MKNSKKDIFLISVILLVVVGIYFIVAYFLKQYYVINITNCKDFKNNEFGDFIGGILNPLFTLLSTVSIIYLTYLIAKGEDQKADNAIETQKRITLNQMRQTALENLIQKTNLYIYEADKLAFHTTKNKMHQMILTNLIKEESKSQERVIVWLIILSELENFSQLKYLFSNLFDKEDFKEKYNDIVEITNKLAEEQDKMNFVENKTIGKYIYSQQIFLNTIGNYIYSEF